MKVNLDCVAGAGDGGRQGGPDVLASSKNVEGAACLLHQGCTVAVLDCHIVVPACVMGRDGNSKCRELHCNNESLLDFNDLRLSKIGRIIVGVVW